MEATRKERQLVDSLAVSADGQAPAFPSGPNSDGRIVFAGDFSGARLLGVRSVVSEAATFTSLAITLQTSHDGVTWVDWMDLTTHTADGTKRDVVLLETDGQPHRFIRADYDITGTSCVLDLYVEYMQMLPKGNLAPPGVLEKLD